MTTEGPGAATRMKRECKYQSEWKKCDSRRAPNFAYCDHCGTETSIVHRGANDVKKYSTTCKHLEVIKIAEFKKPFCKISHR